MGDPKQRMACEFGTGLCLGSVRMVTIRIDEAASFESGTEYVYTTTACEKHLEMINDLLRRLFPHVPEMLDDESVPR